MSVVGVLSRSKSLKPKLPYLVQGKENDPTTGTVSVSSTSEDLSKNSQTSNKPIALEDYLPDPSPAKPNAAKVEEQAPLFSN